MTGATSGFGAQTVRRFAALPDTRVIIGARGSGRTVPLGVEVIPLDLAAVALGTIAPPHGRVYVSLVKSKPTFPDPSELARGRDAQDRLWCESAAMVGIKSRWVSAMSQMLGRVCAETGASRLTGELPCDRREPGATCSEPKCAKGNRHL